MSDNQHSISFSRVVLLTSLALLAFAGNSLLCRLALKHGSIDAASFTTIRLLSGAMTLWLLTLWRRTAFGLGSWLSASALFIYAAGFSFAYINLSAATGALLLFGAVQATMISHGLYQGERMAAKQLIGLLIALAGLFSLLLPGLSAPPLMSALLMLAAGIAWGVYSLRGKQAGDAIAVTAGNFLRAAPLAVAVSVLMLEHAVLSPVGVGYAMASGAVASGIGYAIWYSVLPALRAAHAATLQLSVPVIAALGGVMFLGESLTLRLLLASVAILGGIALVINEARTIK